MVKEDFAVTAIFGKESMEQDSLVASYDFETLDDICVEDKTKHGYPIRLKGNASIIKDDVTGSNVLNLNGTGETFAEFERGMFDHMDEMTVLMDVRSYMGARTNFFTFTVGQNSDKYLFFKLADTQLRGALTNQGHGGEKSADAEIENSWGEWTSLAFVVTKDQLQIYRDKELAAETDLTGASVSGLGEQVSAYLGKSFYPADSYFNGSFDNLKVYNYAMTKEQIDEASQMEYVTVQYEAEEAYGSVQGQAVQRIKKGSKTQEVEAVAKSGYRFVRWSDGITTAKRQESFVSSDRTVTAVFAKESANENGLVFAVDFEAGYQNFAADTSLQGNLLDYHGEAQVIEDSELHSKVLRLNGTAGTFASLPQGLFDGMDSWTLRMKVKPESTQGNFFTFAVGTDDQKYLYFKTMDAALKAVATSSGVSSEQIAEGGVEPCTGKWLDVTIVVKPGSMQVYEGTSLVAEKSGVTVKTSDLGENLNAYFGKSFYGADSYFKGCFDDLELYDYPWESSQITGENHNAKEKIASFSLKDEEGLKGSGALASAEGEAEFKEDAERGTVLALDGTGSCYLKVVKEDGSSLLKGVEEFTVSYYSKAESNDGNWAMYAAKDETAPVYRAEKYIGVMDGLDKIQVERYLNGRDTEPTVVGKGSENWKHVVIAFHKNRTVLYVDGQQTASVGSSNKISDIVGENGIFQIGKANWGNGEYYKGLLSDYRVYNYAMTAEEVERFETTGEPEKPKPQEPADPEKPNPEVPEPEKPKPEPEKPKTEEPGTQEQKAVSSIKLNRKKLTLGVKETFTIRASVSPAGADKKLKWESSRKSVAVVNAKGKVTAKKVGRTTITATASNGKKVSCRILVKKAPKSLRLNAKEKNLKKGKSFQIRVKLPAKTASNKITYTSSRKRIASVSAKGKVKALRKGTAVISVRTFNKKRAVMKIIVK